MGVRLFGDISHCGWGGLAKYGLLLHKPDANELDILKGLVEEGKVIPMIDKCHSLNDIAEAFKYYGEGHVKGKAVVLVSQANR